MISEFKLPCPTKQSLNICISRLDDTHLLVTIDTSGELPATMEQRERKKKREILLPESKPAEPKLEDPTPPLPGIVVLPPPEPEQIIGLTSSVPVPIPDSPAMFVARMEMKKIAEEVQSEKDTRWPLYGEWCKSLEVVRNVCSGMGMQMPVGTERPYMLEQLAKFTVGEAAEKRLREVVDFYTKPPEPAPPPKKTVEDEAVREERLKKLRAGIASLI